MVVLCQQNKYPMKTNQQQLLTELYQLTEQASAAAQTFKNLPVAQLNFKPTDAAWSILECIEHLNLYGKFYLPEIEQALQKSAKVDATNVYKSSFLGDFFVNSIKAGNQKKMKATQMMLPQKSDVSITTLDQFIKQTERLKIILTHARLSDLTKPKTPISLTKFLTLRLGDTLRFLVYHNERHILQAEKMHGLVGAENVLTDK
jgi:hypothetical protein